MSRLIIKDIIICVALLVAICFLFSCRAAKDRKAMNRVLTTPELLKEVGREWEKNNPCVNDTVFAFTAGDTLIDIDTLTETVFDTLTQIVEGQTKTKTVYKTIVKTVTIHDTIKAVTTDNRRLNIALDSMNHYKGLSIQREAVIKEFEHDKKQPGKTFGWLLGSLVRQWWFWLIVLIVAGWLTRRLWGPRIGVKV